MKKLYFYCEGETEFNYIMELSRLLRESDCQEIILIPKIVKISAPSNYYKVIKKLINNLNGSFHSLYVWIDYDIFKRKNIQIEQIKKMLDEIVIPKKLKLDNRSLVLALNIMNGEDFLVLHCENNKINKWEKICKERDHFMNPMTRSEYYPLFKDNIISNYQKGEIPKGFVNLFTIKRAMDNNINKNISFESGIFEALKIIFKDG